MEEQDGEGRSAEDAPQDDLDCLPPYDALHDYGEDEEEEAEEEEEEEGGRRTKSAKRAASGGGDKGARQVCPTSNGSSGNATTRILRLLRCWPRPRVGTSGTGQWCASVVHGKGHQCRMEGRVGRDASSGARASALDTRTPAPDRTTLRTDCARARNPRALPITLAHPPRRANGPSSSPLRLPSATA
jgi:hypothetical protein